MIKQRATLVVGAIALMASASPASAQWTAVPAPNNGGGAFWDNNSADGTNCNIGFVLTGSAGADDCNNQRPLPWLPYAGGVPTHFLGGGSGVGFLFAKGTYRIEQLGSMSLGGDIASVNNLWGFFSLGADAPVPGSNSGSPDIALTMTFTDNWGFWIDLSRPNGERAYSDNMSSGNMFHHALFSFGGTTNVNGNVVNAGYLETLILGMENNGCIDSQQAQDCNQLTDADYNDVILSITAVPEPSTYMLMAAGLFAVGVIGRRRMRA